MLTPTLLHSCKPLPATCPNLRFCHWTSPSPSSPSFDLFNPHRVPSETLALSSTKIAISLRHVRLIASSSSSSSMAASSAQSAGDQKPFAVLFVCLGNICRSPAAEAVFRDLVQKKGLESHFKIDSAGIIDYHEGNPADSRMREASKRRGVEVTSISRPLRSSDFKEFDLILAMDMQNREDILSAYERWSFKESLPADAHKKVKLMCSYCRKHKETEVPDPYYGGPQGFEKVLDLLEDACSTLVDEIIAKNSHITAT